MFQLFLVFLLTGNCFAQEKLTEAETEEGVFWKIQNKESKQISYMFGTIHMIDKDKYVFPKVVSKRLDKSEIVILELNDLDNQSNAMELMMLPKGRMTDLLNKSQRDSLYAYTEENFGLDSALFEKTMGKFKPFFFMQLPYASVMMESESYDMNIYKQCKKSNIPILGLETIEEQIGFFDNLSDNLKSDLIMQIVRDTSDIAQSWEETQNLYLDQKISDLLNQSSGSINMLQFMEETLTADRNTKWISTLTKEMKNKSVFVAVGAAHLPGEKGLIQLLRQNGYDVSRVEIKLK